MRPVLYFVLTTVSIVVAKSSEWDMFALSLTWPVTLCKFSELNKPPQKCVISSKLWTIHGLWPSARNRDHDPENCPISKPFNENEIQNLLEPLNKYWPNQFPRTPKCSFWKHEWEKHGRCATEVRETGSEHLYFNKTLSLRMKYNIDEILSSAGIKPGEKYQLQDIKSDLKQKLGSKPIILCGNVKKVHWISAMVICMDRKFQLFDCPEKRIAERAYFNTPLPPHDRCRAEVFYPMK